MRVGALRAGSGASAGVVLIAALTWPAAGGGGYGDWFKRSYNLAPGESGNLVYGAEFDQNEVELLEL